MAFIRGQRVTVIAPTTSPMLGKKGTIQGPIECLDGFTVLMEQEGNVMAFATQNLRADMMASSSSSQAEHSRFILLENQVDEMHLNLGRNAERIEDVEETLEVVQDSLETLREALDDSRREVRDIVRRVIVMERSGGTGARV